MVLSRRTPEGDFGTSVLEASGETHIGYGPLKNENQDEFSVQNTFAGSKSISYYAVWDGHGSNGKVVAEMAKKRLTEILEYKLTPGGQKSQKLTPDEIKAALKQSFEAADAEVCNSGVDCSRSGTTSTVALVWRNKLYVAAAGDSRAVLGVVDHTDPSGNLRAEPVSIDHRPSRPSEKERLIEAGGRVEPRRAYNGTFIGEERLWLKDIQTPGLMVSRSIGDSTAAENPRVTNIIFGLRQVGCTSTPEIQEVDLDGSQKFVVIASDGIWDVLDNQFVINLAHSTPDTAKACTAIIEAAIERWEDKCAADNITVVIVKFAGEIQR
eukprot:1180052-Prorocentrum_minimum.AAC.2